MKTIKNIITFFVLSTVLISCNVKKVKLADLSFKEQLQELFPSAKIDSIKVNDHFINAFQMVLQQPLDHANLDAGTFDHYVYVSHVNYNKPTVLVTEGYNARFQTYELSKVLKANQVMVEYRFYGKSRPDSIPWKYLKNDAAAQDYHVIVTKLKRIYKQKWLSTGISKGGETVMIYKSKFPEDIDIAVPYVAPLINTQQDQRTNNLINSIGTENCREKIKKFQRAVLINRERVMAEFKKYANDKKVFFTQIPIEEALEHAVLEFPFSFWQWGSKCEDIPDEKEDAKTLFEYLKKVSGFYLFSDAGVYNYLPSFYQHMSELGYYGYNLEPVKDLLQYVKTSSLLCFGPKNVDLSYNSNYIKEVRSYMENKGDKTLYIYGGNDPWGACAPNPKPNIDALKMVLKGGHHGTRIKDFSKKDQQKIFQKLQSWLGKEVKMFPIK